MKVHWDVICRSGIAPLLEFKPGYCVKITGRTEGAARD